jgi:hypothetical protein
MSALKNKKCARKIDHQSVALFVNPREIINNDTINSPSSPNSEIDLHCRRMDTKEGEIDSILSKEESKKQIPIPFNPKFGKKSEAINYNTIHSELTGKEPHTSETLKTRAWKFATSKTGGNHQKYRSRSRSTSKKGPPNKHHSQAHENSNENNVSTGSTMGNSLVLKFWPNKDLYTGSSNLENQFEESESHQAHPGNVLDRINPSKKQWKASSPKLKK